MKTEVEVEKLNLFQTSVFQYSSIGIQEPTLGFSFFINDLGRGVKVAE